MSKLLIALALIAVTGAVAQAGPDAAVPVAPNAAKPDPNAKFTPFTYGKGRRHLHPRIGDTRTSTRLPEILPSSNPVQPVRVQADTTTGKVYTPKGLHPEDKFGAVEIQPKKAKKASKKTHRPRIIKHKKSRRHNHSHQHVHIHPRRAHRHHMHAQRHEMGRHTTAPTFSVGDYSKVGVSDASPVHRHHFNKARVHIHDGRHHNPRFPIDPTAADLKELEKAVDDHLRS